MRPSCTRPPTRRARSCSKAAPKAANPPAAILPAAILSTAAEQPGIHPRLRSAVALMKSGRAPRPLSGFFLFGKVGTAAGMRQGPNNSRVSPSPFPLICRRRYRYKMVCLADVRHRDGHRLCRRDVHKVRDAGFGYYFIMLGMPAFCIGLAIHADYASFRPVTTSWRLGH